MQAWSYLGRRSVRSSTMSPIDQARATCCTVCPVYRARHSPDSRCRAIPPFSHRPSEEKGLYAQTTSRLIIDTDTTQRTRACQKGIYRLQAITTYRASLEMEQ